MPPKDNKWVYIIGGFFLLIIIIVGFSLTGNATNTTPPSGNQGGGSGTGGGNPPPPPPPTDPKQVLKTYTCETRKVCQGRGGYANWVKTGTQKKCNASNVSQALCIADCLGTCYAWVTE